MNLKQWARDRIRGLKVIEGWMEEAYQAGKNVGRAELLSEIERRESLQKIGRRELHVEKVGARAYCSAMIPEEDRRKYAQRILAQNIGSDLMPYIEVSKSPDRAEPGLIRYDGCVRVVIDG